LPAIPLREGLVEAECDLLWLTVNFAPESEAPHE
jgi:hypothetical protein